MECGVNNIVVFHFWVVINVSNSFKQKVGLILFFGILPILVFSKY